MSSVTSGRAGRWRTIGADAVHLSIWRLPRAGRSWDSAISRIFEIQIFCFYSKSRYTHGPLSQTLVRPVQLGAVLQAARKTQGLTQSALAARIGLSQSRVSPSGAEMPMN
ncbi:helix-turn-helix domain-containing protein [Bordetella genomosp. 9]|uniref:helix-turn-helix domain-containing protein n=1 Tax=Bordetella genomosp. 9 TaxID=1416803 RepID=UPI003B281E2C